VKEINIYPIKSCKGISLQRAKIGPYGFENDRRWMLYNTETNRFLTQRQHPQMALVTPRFEGEHLCLDFPALETLRIPISGKEQKQGPIVQEIGLWKASVRGVDEGDEVAEWFKQAIRVKFAVRLIRLCDNHDRQVPEDYAQKDMKKEKQLVSFADGFPFLVISEDSLTDLNSRMEKPLPMKRFRPNIVINGCEPFEEDVWQKVKIGSTVFRHVKKCTRCKLTTVDPDQGEFAGDDPLKTLRTYRKGLLEGAKDEVCFGQNLIHENIGGEVQVGQTVEILE